MATTEEESTLTVPTPLETWRALDPAFRGAVIARLRDHVVADRRATILLTDRNHGDPDVDALAARQSTLCDATMAAIGILQGAGR